MFTTNNLDKITIKQETKVIKTGYISKVSYRNKFQMNSEIGIKEREAILDLIESIISDIDVIGDSIIHHEYSLRGNNLTLEVMCIDQILRFNFDTISSIVSQNKDRKINREAYLPFDKDMDKYNSIYVSIQCSNITETSYDIAERLLYLIVKKMNSDSNQFYFKSMNLNNPI